MAQNGAHNFGQTFFNSQSCANGSVNGQVNMNQASQTFSQNPNGGSNVSYNNGNSSQFVQMNSASPVFQQQCVSPVRNDGFQYSQNSDMLSLILQRLESMDCKLLQLESIQRSVNSLTSRMDSMDRKINQLECKMRDVENSRDFDSNLLGDLTKNKQELDTDEKYK